MIYWRRKLGLYLVCWLRFVILSFMFLGKVCLFEFRLRFNFLKIAGDVWKKLEI